MKARYLGTVKQQYITTTTTILTNHKDLNRGHYLLKGLTTRECEANEGKTFRIIWTTITPIKYSKSIYKEQEQLYTIKN